MRILVTNDDGVDAVGLRVLTEAVSRFGEVVVVAPDGEYSGSGAAIGAVYQSHPVVHDAHVSGAARAWAVVGPPGLCVFLARLGLFGPPPDLVVAGINPGANVGRLVYHSGTVGAALTARTGGISAVAFSQEVTGGAIEGQGSDEAVVGQRWDTAAAVAETIVGALVMSLPSEPSVLNVNVPNRALGEIRGWRYCELGTVPPRSMKSAWLEPRPGHDGSYTAHFRYGERVTLPETCDTGAVGAGYVSLTWLGRIAADAGGHGGIESSMDQRFEG